MLPLINSPGFACQSALIANHLHLSFDEKAKLFARKIDKRIKDLGLTKQEFAKLMNVPPSSITKWLSGRHNFTIETISEIERKLSVSLIDLNPLIDSPITIYSLHISSSDLPVSNPVKILNHLANTFESDVHVSNVQKSDIKDIYKSLDHEIYQEDNLLEIDYYRIIKQNKKP